MAGVKTCISTHCAGWAALCTQPLSRLLLGVGGGGRALVLRGLHRHGAQLLHEVFTVGRVVEERFKVDLQVLVEWVVVDEPLQCSQNLEPVGLQWYLKRER